jgi:hypothetical protein
MTEEADPQVTLQIGTGQIWAGTLAILTEVFLSQPFQGKCWDSASIRSQVILSNSSVNLPHEAIVVTEGGGGGIVNRRCHLLPNSCVLFSQKL